MFVSDLTMWSCYFSNSLQSSIQPRQQEPNQLCLFTNIWEQIQSSHFQDCHRNSADQYRTARDGKQRNCSEKKSASKSSKSGVDITSSLNFRVYTRIIPFWLVPSITSACVGVSMELIGNHWNTIISSGRCISSSVFEVHNIYKLTTPSQKSSLQ